METKQIKEVFKAIDNYVCDKCGEHCGIFALGYLGPKDREDTSCNPLVKFECLCCMCDEKRADPK